ncbi:MAG: hypothetical protein WBD16_12475 [Pyrinomonadaceae bacterium]
MSNRIKLTDVSAALAVMHAKGIIGKYAVGGASAVAFYAEPIATKDLDIFFLFEPPQDNLILSLEPIYDYCRENGYSHDHEFISIGGWDVQFVEAGHDELWKDALADARTFTFDGSSIDVLAPEHLAAMWSSVARPKDILKILHFISYDVLDSAKLKKILERFDMIETWRKIQAGVPDEFRY